VVRRRFDNQKAFEGRLRGLEQGDVAAGGVERPDASVAAERDYTRRLEVEF
jgi:hypothetical protein